MAVMQNSIIFGGVDSADFGIYISGEGVFDAPKRAVEVIQVPGRNGAITIDQGYYENIRVTYPAFNYEVDLETFSNQLEAFRNAICSQIGYQRLTDTIHPDEYRMAVYYEGLEIKPIMYNTAATFDIVFDCKPQRWLVSGEEIQTVANNGTLKNPTLFDSSPLLAVNGYGDIGVGDYNIHIDDVLIGTIPVSDKITVQNQNLVRTWNINEDQYNAGDTVTINGLKVKTTFKITNSATFQDFQSPDRTMGIEYYNSTDQDATLAYSKSGKTATFSITVPTIQLTIGQNLSKSYSIRATVNVEIGSEYASNRVYEAYTINYTNGILSISADALLFNREGYLSIANPQETCTIELGAITGDSTLSILDDTVYIDCEIGEVYAIRADSIASLNSIVDLGSDLPVLVPGTNTFTYDNTVTQLKVTPRWWQL